MEGPEIAGPKVWLDLNRKCEAKIIALINKNKARVLSTNMLLTRVITCCYRKDQAG